MIGYVYKITLPNKYSYIGSHKSEVFDENYWGSSLNYKYWQALFLAGKENVKREILGWYETEQELIQAEYLAMQENKKYLYNLSKPKSIEEKRLKNNNDTKYKICPVCGKEFIPSKNHPNQKYCCSACTSKASRLGLGTGKAWNKGLTKETNESIKKTSEKLKGKPTWSKGLKLVNRRRPDNT